jgi:hypothetical protein
MTGNAYKHIVNRYHIPCGLQTAGWWSKACRINKYFEPGCVENLIKMNNPGFALLIKHQEKSI